MTDDATESTIRVIQKLLSRAEATDYEHEREACLAKVAELMARHSIEEAVLAARPGAEDAGAPVELLMEVPAPYAARKVSLFGAVGSSCGCTVIDIGDDDRRVRRVALIGFAGDVRRSEVLITSLLVQLTRSMLDRPPGRAPSRTAGATAAWRRSFISGFTWRVQERLSEARASERARADRERAGASSRPGHSPVALALAERERQVDAEVRRRYPHLRTRRMDGGSSAHGHRAGLDAGDRADLGAPRIPERRALRA